MSKQSRRKPAPENRRGEGGGAPEPANAGGLGGDSANLAHAQQAAASDMPAWWYESQRAQERRQHFAALDTPAKLLVEIDAVRAALLAEELPRPETGAEREQREEQGRLVGKYLLWDKHSVARRWAGDAEAIPDFRPLWEAAARLPADPLPPCPPTATTKAEAYRQLDALAAAVKAPAQADAAGKIGDEAPPDEHVTLEQMAATVSRSKRTLEKRKTRGTNLLPAPDVEGGGGKPDEWKWSKVRPWLEREYGRKLPERFPRSRFIDGRTDRS